MNNINQTGILMAMYMSGLCFTIHTYAKHYPLLWTIGSLVPGRFMCNANTDHLVIASGIII